MELASQSREKSQFFPVSEFYKKLFGEKVFKIPVSISGRCPNMKDGTGLKTCIFCDEWGSFAYPENQEKSLKEQILIHKERVAKRYKTNKFFVYFQAYTTSYTQVQKIRESFKVALEVEGVVGIIIGTRPDCLSPALLDTFNEIAEKSFMGVELGVQSFDDKQLLWMRRGHTAQQSKDAVKRIKQNCPKVNLGIHLMFGWPNESQEDVINAAKICNELKIDNVKLHNLHVLKNTALEEIFNSGKFTPIELNDYAERVAEFINHLSPDIAIHRLIATASRWEELVSPKWTRSKMYSYQFMIDYLKDNNIYQGSRI